MKNVKTNLNLYKSFVEIYETKNYSVAALNLRLTQPTMSYNIRELEKQLKVRLFNTNSRGVEPTKYAEELYPLVRKAFTYFLTAEQTILEFNEKSQGVIFLRTSLYYMPQIASNLISQFNKKYPGVKFEITSSTVTEGIDALDRHESDLMIYTCIGKDDNNKGKFTTVNLIELENAFFASKEFIKKHKLDGITTIEQLSNVPMLSVPSVFQVSKDLKDIGLAKEPIIETNSTQMLISLAKDGMGIVFGPSDFMDNGLVKIQVKDLELPKYYIAIKYNNELANKAGIAFIDMILKAYNLG